MEVQVEQEIQFEKESGFDCLNCPSFRSLFRKKLDSTLRFPAEYRLQWSLQYSPGSAISAAKLTPPFVLFSASPGHQA